MDSGLAKMVRKIHKNVESKFSEEVIKMAKDIWYIWKEYETKKDSHNK